MLNTSRSLDSLSSSQGGVRRNRSLNSQPAPLFMKVEVGMQQGKSNTKPSVHEAVKSLICAWIHWTTSRGHQKWYCNHVQTARHHRSHPSHQNGPTCEYRVVQTELYQCHVLSLSPLRSMQEVTSLPYFKVLYVYFLLFQCSDSEFCFKVPGGGIAIILFSMLLMGP